MAKIKLIIFLVLFGLLALSCGIYIGEYLTATFFIKAGYSLLEHQKINISIDEKMLQTGIMQYKERVGGCLFLGK